VSEQNKALRFTIAIDEGSARRARSFVQELTSDVERLITTAQRAASAMGNMGGGVGAVSVESRRSGGDATAQRAASATQKTGILGRVLQTVVGGGSSESLRGVSKDVESTLQASSAAIRGFANAAEADVTRVSRALTQLHRLSTTRGAGGQAPNGPTAPGPGPGVIGEVPAGNRNDPTTQLVSSVQQLIRVLGTNVGHAPTLLGMPAVSPEAPTSTAPTRERRSPTGTLLNGPEPSGAGGSPPRQPPAPRRGGGKGKGEGGEIPGAGVVGGISTIASQTGLGGAGTLAGMVGRFGVVGGAIAAGGLAYNYLAGSSADTRKAALNYELGEPIRQQQRAAAVASPFNEAWGRVRHGSVSYALAFDQASKDLAIQGSLRKTAQREEQALREAGVIDPTFSGAARKVRSKMGQNSLAEWMGGQISFGQLMDRSSVQFLTQREEMRQRMAEGKSTIMDRLQPDFQQMSIEHQVGLKRPALPPEVRAMSGEIPRELLDFASEQAKRELPVKQAQDLQQAAAARYELLNPRVKETMDRVYGGAMGEVSMARTGFLSSGYTRNKAGEIVGYAPMDLEAKLTRLGYDRGEYAQTRRGVVSSAGMGYLNKVDATGLMSMRYGGLQGAEGLLRAGGMLGGSVGAGADFLLGRREAGGRAGGVQQSIGRGGLDVTEGSELFQDLTRRALQIGQFGAGDTFSTYASGVASLVAGGIGAPLDVAEQQRRAHQVAQGQEAFGQITTGKAAPLYEAASVLNAIKATGGRYSLATEALRGTAPEVLQGIVRGGKVPQGLLSQFNTEAEARRAAKSFLKSSAAAPLLEIPSDPRYATGKGGELLREFKKAGGDFGDLADRRLKAEGISAKSKKGQARLGEMAEQLGGSLAAFAPRLAANPEAGAGIFLSQLVGDERFAPMLKGKGAHGAGPTDATKQALNAQAEQAERDSKAFADVHDTFKKTVAAMPGQTDQAGAAVGAAAAGFDPKKVEVAEASFVKALDIMTQVLLDKADELRGGSGPARVRK
jgi:hypothetical protein